MVTTDDTTTAASAFKKAQVFHRRRAAEPNRLDDLPELIDFSSQNLLDERCVSIAVPNYGGPVYGLSSFPGFWFVPQALSQSLQQELAFAAVSEYCEQPHRTNIDLQPPKPHQTVQDISMWELWKQSKDSKTNTPTNCYKSFRKLSWSTLGYHYDWTARAYHKDAKSPVPPLLAKLSSFFAKLQSASGSYCPSACIVNYYNSKSIMGGHRDDLELALDKPIVSLSLGLPAVFLLGGKSKEEDPLAILVRPGDVMMMGGDTRLNYHGMARVIPCPLAAPVHYKHEPLTTDSLFRSPRQKKNISETDRQALAEYLANHRININVRQVFPDDSC